MSDNTAMGDSPSSSTGRVQLLTETFVALADTLVDDYDIADLLDRLVTASVELLSATAAGLLLIDQQGKLTVVASSSEETRLLELFQIQNDEGPCLDCVRGGVQVTSQSLADDHDRWPRFAPRAGELDIRSVTAVPLRLRDETIGGLNLFQAGGVPPMSADDRRLAQALADVATIGILQQRVAHRGSLLAEQLQQALTSRIAIEQAKGVLAERHDVSMDIAFAALRRFARNNNLRLSGLAMSVVRGEVQVDIDES
jgi:GAF domain-containing protein